MNDHQKLRITSSIQSSTDGSIKFIFEKASLRFEGIYFHYVGPDFCGITPRGAAVVCVSSQAGCAFGCSFCATGKAGFSGNLVAEDIIGQVLLARRHTNELDLPRIECVALMGMGEPLSSFDSTLGAAAYFYKQEPEITFCISTVGVAGKIRKLADTGGHRTLLYASVHSPFNSERTTIIPNSAIYSVEQLIEDTSYYALITGTRVTLSYLLLDGVNDSERHADALAALASREHHSIQILLYNSIGDDVFGRTADLKAEAFQRKLSDQGYFAYIQKSQGRDIGGGCGQLDEVIRRKSKP